MLRKGEGPPMLENILKSITEKAQHFKTFMDIITVITWSSAEAKHNNNTRLFTFPGYWEEESNDLG